jgi:hypothetical protein
VAATDFILRPLQGFKSDPIGFLTRGVDNGQRVPQTKTKTSFSLTIHAVVGQRRGVIGAVQEIGVRQRQTIDEEYEIDSVGLGLPRELVPQTIEGRTITLRRYDLYQATLEQVFGAPELITLADQLGPVSLRFMWRNPNFGDIDLITQQQETMAVYEYTDCWITDLGRTMSASGDIIVKADATLVWRNCRRLQ